MWYNNVSLVSREWVKVIVAIFLLLKKQLFLFWNAGHKSLNDRATSYSVIWQNISWKTPILDPHAGCCVLPPAVWYVFIFNESRWKLNLFRKNRNLFRKEKNNTPLSFKYKGGTVFWIAGKKVWCYKSYVGLL